jgi:hypothetical protein
MRNHIALFVACASLALAAVAQTGKIPIGAKIYIQPMEGHFDDLIAGEIAKQKLPVTVVTSKSDAAYVLLGAAGEQRATSWTSKAVGAVRLIDEKTNTMVWATDARSKLRKGGYPDVARRIVAEMKKAIRKE